MLMIVVLIMAMMSGDLRLQLHITKPNTLGCHYVRGVMSTIKLMHIKPT